MPKDTLPPMSSSTISDSGHGLKLPLQRALESLSVDLDAELIRYRQSRQGEATTPAPRRLALRKRRSAINLIRVQGREDAVGALADAPVPPQAMATASPPMTASAIAAAEQVPAPSPTVPAVPMTPPPLPPNPRLAQSTQRFSPESAISAPVDAGAAGAIAEARVVEPGDLLVPGGSLAPYQPIPEDYLETTEALLRSAVLGDDPELDLDDGDYAPPLTERLMTPLGIGALLLLLVGSAGLGYLFTNPAAIAHLLNHPLLQALRGSQEGSRGAEGNAEPRPSASFNPSLEGLGPDLSSQEFIELNLESLSTLPVDQAKLPTAASTPTTETVSPTAVTPNNNPLPSPAMTPGPVITPADPSAVPPVVATAPTPTYRPPSTVPTTVRPIPAPASPAPPPEPVYQPAPQPLSEPDPEPAATTPPVAPNYYVVTDYTGDQSLDNARTAVEDAYVRNFSEGARIQMGAFDEESSAQELVQQLEQQGIPAQVYPAE